MSKKIELWTSETCGPCRLIKNYVQHWTDKEISFVKLEDKHYMFIENNIKSVPHIRFYLDEVMVHSVSGFVPEEKMLEIYDNLEQYNQ